ncbi:sensor histidine kinase [Desulfurivibrio dismutans]|uniref:sensor histidine kinase n=1 Tax=Desulfurivibrio dismutans TaxID=1398908 RepID=UPI0023DBE503|nr:HAMP domain-containing sensor histidine kinase [Desulfurivibrio alkaliphilus]MDF1615313.1 HAMP domain-containing sensor histidine kinase [Desulfurivibrio alkaliphilus]
MTASCDSPCIFRDILGDIDTGLLVLDTVEEAVSFVNQHARGLLESLGGIPGYHELSRLLGAELENLQRPGRKKSRQAIVRYEHRMLGYTVSCLPNHGRYVSVFVQDITDQHRLAAVDEATEMMNNIGCLFSGIRHEIGNPLNSIKMALMVLQNNIHKYSNEETDVYLQRIAGEIGKMEVLLKSFKNFSMFEVPKTSEVDLVLFFEDLLQLMGSDLRARNIDVRLELAPDAQRVVVDTRALQHVIMNLFANALDAMGGVDHPRLVVLSRKRRDAVQLVIGDNGCGMSDELAKDAFKPFFTTKSHGTGLGLVIVKKMLAQMRCGIRLESVKDQGSAFILTLPVTDRHPDPCQSATGNAC